MDNTSATKKNELEVMSCIWVAGKGWCPHFFINSDNEFIVKNEKLRHMPISIADSCRICLQALDLEIKYRIK